VGWALPVGIVGAVFLIREIKGGGAAAEEAARRIAAEAAAKSEQALIDLLEAASASGAAAGEAYYAAEDARSRQAALEAAIADTERLAALQRTTGEAAGAAGNYGTVDGAIGSFSGDWVNVSSGTGDRCSVDFITVSGRASRFFTGAYCRSARAQGLIA